MKKSVYIISGIITLLLIASFFLLKSFIIQNPKPDECVVIELKVSKITEGGVKDIVFHNPDKDYYYINRGLEQGLNLDSLKTKVLNKTVTLHIVKLAFGPSRHIAQLAIEDQILFTEF